MHSQLVTAIKKLALDAVESTKPVIVQFGTVIQDGPDFKVRVEQKLTLERKHFIERDTRKLDTLESGDQLTMLRVQGGKRYYLLEVTRDDTDSQ